MKISELIKNLAIRIIYPNKSNSEVYANYLRKLGCKIGKQTIIAPFYTTIDVTRPYLLNIGDYCKITKGVVILTHDYSYSVIRMKYKEIMELALVTNIGNNVFIGMNAIILPGIKIGNNVIIGAGSVVANDIPDDSVAAGNPAKVIMTLDEYYEKRKSNYLNSAKEYAKLIYSKTGKNPTITDMSVFYPLFLKRDLNEIKKYNLRIRLSGDDYDDVVSCFLQSKPKYKNFEEFLIDCGL